MTSERDAGSREIARWLREELARIRTSEAQVEQALQALRGARRRVEEIALSMEREDERVRALVREEIEASGGAGGPERAAGPAGLPWRRAPEEGWARSGPPPAGAGEHDTEGAGAASAAPARPSAGAAPAGEAEPARVRERRRLVLVALVAAVAVVVVGWLAFQGLREGVSPDAVVMTPGEGAGDAAGEGVNGGALPAAGPGDEDVLATLPGTPAARVALYDSLFEARAPLFDPLLDSVASLTDDDGVESALAAFREGGDLSALERDAVHSALVQWILMREIDQRVEIDGELLRNPCRGTSCSALLNLWQIGGDAYGFPEVPDDAPTNSEGLRTVEAMLVLERMQDLHVGAAPAGDLGG